MSAIFDAVIYLALAGASFWFTVWLWRLILGVTRNNLERFLFWGTWVGFSIMAAGIYHVATGERDFGRLLMALALAEALVVMVGVNVFAGLAFRKPYDPEKDPEFIAYIEERRRQLDDMRRQLTAQDRRMLP